MKDLEILYKFSLCSAPSKGMFLGTVVDASIVKYMINTFLAVKVEFFNEWKDVADIYGVAWPTIANMVSLDPRIGPSHTKVPGPDGKRGFGGACFPKDLNAILAEKDMPLLAVTRSNNNDRRQQYEKDAREVEQNVKFE